MLNTRFIVALREGSTGEGGVLQFQFDTNERNNPIFASVRVPGKPKSAEEAIAVMVNEATVKWRLPAEKRVHTSKDGTTTEIRFKLNRPMSGKRAASMLCYFGGFAVPETLTDEDYIKELLACGVDIVAERKADELAEIEAKKKRDEELANPSSPRPELPTQERMNIQPTKQGQGKKAVTA